MPSTKQEPAPLQRIPHPLRNPTQVYEYKLGNRSALEWVIDQYQVSTDKRSGIVNNPNRTDGENADPEYIVRLVGQVITVSLETVRLVTELSTLPIQPAAQLK